MKVYVKWKNYKCCIVLKWEELKPVHNVLVKIIILDIVFKET